MGKTLLSIVTVMLTHIPVDFLKRGEKDVFEECGCTHL